jgi:hypothetical protein
MLDIIVSAIIFIVLVYALWIRARDGGDNDNNDDRY